MLGSRRLRLQAILTAAVILGGGSAWADALSDANALVLENPASIKLNLNYALIAEEEGEYRLALAAYERILLNHPGNSQAQRGLARMRRIIQPPFTRTFIEVGVAAESNAEHVPNPSDFDFVGFGRVSVRDERTVGETRWRTEGLLYGEVHTESDSLNYANANATIGPIFDLGAALVSLRPAIGGGIAMLDNQFYYVDANVSATFDSYDEGPFQWLRLRAGYRQYDEDLTSDNGFYLDATARFSEVGVFVDNDAVSFTPIIRWNNVNGVFNDNVDDFSPGKYVYGGARLAYFLSLNDLVTVGASVGVYDRYFLVDKAPNGDDRNDVVVIPGVSVLFKNVFGPRTGIRLKYDFEYSDSNDPGEDYDNHVIGLSLISRR